MDGLDGLQEEPQDRLTRMCARMTDLFDADPEREEGDKCIVFLDDRANGGIVLHGYDDATEALADLFMHMQAIMKANGKKLDIMFLDEDGIDRVNG